MTCQVPISVRRLLQSAQTECVQILQERCCKRVPALKGRRQPEQPEMREHRSIPPSQSISPARRRLRTKTGMSSEQGNGHIAVRLRDCNALASDRAVEVRDRYKARKR